MVSATPELSSLPTEASSNGANYGGASLGGTGLNEGDPTANEAVAESLEQMRLLSELTRLRSQDRERTARIHHLEKALDQALSCMDELRLQMQDQGLLETQLAATEKFASVQQQAIARLKARLKQQQQTIDAQLAEAYERDRLYQEKLAAAEARFQEQQEELDRLRIQLSSLTQANGRDGRNGHRESADATRQRMQELEESADYAQELSYRLQGQLEAAQQQVQHFAVALSAAENRIAEMESTLAQSQAAQGASLESGLRSALPSSAIRTRPAARRTNAIATLGQDLARAQIKADELEIELGRQMRLQTMWLQNNRELEAECDRYRARIADLEAQNSDLQEQIFQHARQVSEYEATIHHWKDQYIASQRQIASFKELLDSVQVHLLASEQVDPELTAIFSELMTMMEVVVTLDNSSLSSLSTPPTARFNSLDLPDFLLRCRSHRHR
jgi:chromosome segregation ATPase